jgi:hypothetical protein
MCCTQVRLRPHGDPDSFLPEESVLGTLLHELVHNVQVGSTMVLLSSATLEHTSHWVLISCQQQKHLLQSILPALPALHLT